MIVLKLKSETNTNSRSSLTVLHLHYYDVGLYRIGFKRKNKKALISLITLELNKKMTL